MRAASSALTIMSGMIGVRPNDVTAQGVRDGAHQRRLAGALRRLADALGADRLVRIRQFDDCPPKSDGTSR